MTITYIRAPDIKKRVDEIIQNLDFYYIPSKSIYCFRSIGSKSRRIVARIHGLGKIWQEAIHISPSYIIEVISERYDPLPDEEKEMTLIHELLHIPHGFKGGFRPHKGYIDKQTVKQLYIQLHKTRKSFKSLSNG